jgi:hypothetical protein
MGTIQKEEADPNEKGSAPGVRARQAQKYPLRMTEIGKSSDS